MNSVKIANKTWRWIKGCSVRPCEEVIKDYIQKLADKNNALPFAAENAWYRLKIHMKAVDAAYEKIKDQKNAHCPAYQHDLSEFHKIVESQIVDGPIIADESHIRWEHNE